MPNQIVEIYRGHKIRNYNKLQIRVNQFEFKRFIDAKLDMGLSVRQILEYSGRPCEKCSAEILITSDNLKKCILTKKK